MPISLVFSALVASQAPAGIVHWIGDGTDRLGRTQLPDPILIATDAQARHADDAAPARSWTGERVNIDVREADIRSVLRLLSAVRGSDFDFAVSDEVQATVDVQLVDVPWDLALQTILSLEGLQAEAGAGGILVISVADRP